MALTLDLNSPKAKSRTRAKPQPEPGRTAESEIDSTPELRKRRIRAKPGAVGAKNFVIGTVLIVRANPDQRIELLRTGFPATVVQELADRIGWSREHAFEALRLKRSTVMRKIKDEARLETSESERLLSVMDIIEQVKEMVERSGNPQGFDASRWVGDWLDTPNPALAGKRPAEYLDTNEGVQIVRRLLAQMESGAYA